MEKKKFNIPFAERVLRLLVTQGWFREPKQGYFANNRLSNLIKKDQAGYHIATYMLVLQGVYYRTFVFFSYYCFRNGLFAKVAASFSEMMNHPDIEFRKNTDPFHTAFQLAFNTDIAYFGAGGWLTKYPKEAVKFGLR